MDTFSAARVLLTHLGLKDKATRMLGGEGDTDIHRESAPDTHF